MQCNLNEESSFCQWHCCCWCCCWCWCTWPPIYSSAIPWISHHSEFVCGGQKIRREEGKRLRDGHLLFLQNLHSFNIFLSFVWLLERVFCWTETVVLIFVGIINVKLKLTKTNKRYYEQYIFFLLELLWWLSRIN